MYYDMSNIVSPSPEGSVDTNYGHESRQRQQTTKDLKKTRFCSFAARGQCAYGTDCIFAHSVTELRIAPDLKKTRMCPKYLAGKCANRQCNFAHAREELRETPSFKQKRCIWFSKGMCQNGEECAFAHGFKEVRAQPTDALDDAVMMNKPSPPPGLPDVWEPEIFAHEEEAEARLGLQDTIADLKCRLALLEGIASQAQVSQVKQSILELRLMSNEGYGIDTRMATPLNPKAKPFVVADDTQLSSGWSSDSTSAGSYSHHD